MPREPSSSDGTAARSIEPSLRGPSASRPRRSWRRWLVALHRDIGYLAVGLTLVYAISGLATNHRRDWDYDRSTRVTWHRSIAPAELLASTPARRRALSHDVTALEEDEARALGPELLRALGLPGPARNTIWRSPDRVVLYLGAGDEHTVEYHLRDGVAVETKRRERPLLRDLNFLHLNQAGGLYTFVADGYAVVLIFLGASGALITRGSRGLRGRGGAFLVAGILLPIGVVLWHRYR